MTARRARSADDRWDIRLLVVVTAIMVVFGIANTYSASSLQGQSPIGANYALTQFYGAALGLLLMSVVSRVDYHRWRSWAWPLLAVVLVALVILVLPFTERIAPTINGARRWLAIGPLRFQPSEVAKLVVVVWCAMLAAKKGDTIRQFKQGLLPFLTVLGLVSLLILLEPNLSMAALVTLVGAVVLFSAGARLGHFLLLGLVAAILAVQQIMMAGYRLQRALTFLNPDEATSAASHQISQSLLGFGSGRLFGVGFGQGYQKLGYLPYGYSDFLFASIGEEWGFLGAITVVILYGAYLWVGFRIARSAKDAFGAYLAAGLTASVGISAVLHMGVTLALLPTTGLTLPFMSYGRTSLMIALVGTGILLNIGYQRSAAKRG